jgi:hypothetical protein
MWGKLLNFENSISLLFPLRPTATHAKKEKRA